MSAFKHGWVTNLDGSRTPLTADDADALMAGVRESERLRAEAYPSTIDALRAFLDADQRMSDLGWRKSMFRLEDGTELALCEQGSTGIFRAFWNKPYLHYQDCVASMGKHYIKPISDLTPDERAKMDECADSHAEFMVHHTKQMQALSALLSPENLPDEEEEKP